MTIVIEFDKRWAGIGIDYMSYIRGFRCGYFAIHFVKAPFHTLMEFSDFRDTLKMVGE